MDGREVTDNWGNPPTVWNRPVLFHYWAGGQEAARRNGDGSYEGFTPDRDRVGWMFVRESGKPIGPFKSEKEAWEAGVGVGAVAEIPKAVINSDLGDDVSF